MEATRHAHPFRSWPTTLPLSKEAIEQLLESESLLTDYITTAYILAVEEGLARITNPNTSPNAVMGLIEALRKARSDLVGTHDGVATPTMQVNFSFSRAQTQLDQPPILLNPLDPLPEPQPIEDAKCST